MTGSLISEDTDGEGTNGKATRSSNSSLGLVCIFIGTFLVPIYLTWYLAPVIFSSNSSSETPVNEVLAPPIVLQVRTPAHFISVPSSAGGVGSPALHPINGKDFVVWSWFRMARLPQVGDRTFLLRRYDGQGPGPHPGYALAFSREADGLRPTVYWKGLEDKGRWFSFAQVPLGAKEWFLASIAYHDSQRVLELTISTSDGVIRAGAYELEDEWLPQSDASLALGAVSDRDFRGKVGPFGVLSGNISAARVRDFHLSFLKNSAVLPAFVSEKDSNIENLLFVSEDGVDKSSYSREVRFAGKNKKKSRKEGGASSS